MGNKRSVNHIKNVVTSLKKNGDREAKEKEEKEEEREEVGDDTIVAPGATSPPRRASPAQHPTTRDKSKKSRVQKSTRIGAALCV